MLEAARRLEDSSIEVAVIPENHHFGALPDIQKAELAPGGSLLGLLGVQGRLWFSCVPSLCWEEVPAQGQAAVSSFRLLAVGAQCDLKLLEVEAERPAAVSVLCWIVYFLFSGACELRSLRVLSFVAGRCRLLLNSVWLLQLQWPQAEEQPRMSSCCGVQLTESERHAAVDHCVCRGTLFVLSSAGLITVHDVTDGRLLASVDLPAYLNSALPEEDSVSSSSSFYLLQVSGDLSTAVAVTQSHAAVAVNLDHYFRVYPHHLLCAAPHTRPPLQPQHPRDQDSLLSCSLTALGSALSTDRSWEAHLASMYSRAQLTPAPSSTSQPVRTSWSSSLPHLGSHQAPSLAHSRVPCGGATVVFVVPELSTPSLLSVSEFSAMLTFVCPGNQQATVALWDLGSGSVSYHCVEGEAAPVQRCGERHHRLLLKKAGLFQVLFSVSQQDLLSRLMLFGSAATVDVVCHLNSWGRCSIPIHALQAGLKNRQLDTVDFYLKSKENVLHPSAVFGAADQPVASSLSLTDRVQELCPALDLLCSAVRDSNSDAQSRQFSEQLLNITSNFINTQIRRVLSDTHFDEAGVRCCVAVLDRYVTELRSYMKRFPWPAGGDTSSRHCAAHDEWEQLPTEEVVRRSILTNQIPRAQAVLRRRSCPEQRLSALRMEGLRQVLSSLQLRDLQTANRLLTNMGVSVKKQLHSICLHTNDKDLREFVVKLKSLSRPFRMVRMLHREAAGAQEFLEELVGPMRSEEDRGLWRNLRLDWVRNWDQSCQTEVLLSRLPHTELHSCESAVLWRYLTALHDQQRVVSWIQNSESNEASRWPELTPELVNSNTMCSSYLRENILDLLARYSSFKLLENLSTVPLRDLSCIVELLIVAHDCFSLTCNMEGIVRVLQAARHLSHTYLAPREQYSLLVRLLTGIGRYNEMTYVFDLLHQNHRFEMLLRKKVDTDGLKTALLDYIKRCLPADSEKHNMVALCFTMRREIGENHEMAARTQLKIIESQAWVVTPELKSSLIKVLGLLKDAAESFSKDSCVRQASRCVRMAKLVALQLHFLNQGSDLRVINLRPAELQKTVVELPRCYQVFVLSEAYGYSPDWAEILYCKVILTGDFAYLEELKRHRPLTSMFNQCSTSTALLTRLLTHCDDVYSRYRLAYQQHLHDVTKTMLQDAKTSSYLNDRLSS
uniref:SPG11 vesicle trafficking associated, spatacsin n=1 Tax=Mastacembelus armatus TaxID=205130 RepID=A0A3Q3SBJ8_9TELE